MDLSRLINVIQSLLTIIVTAVPTIVLALGCTQDATGAIECSQAMISPKLLASLIAVIGFLKGVVLPWFAPGGWIKNMWGARAAVVPATSTAATPGTVPPNAVR